MAKELETPIVEAGIDNQSTQENLVEQEAPQNTNLKDFFSKFLQSTQYKQAFEDFYRGKTLASDVTEDEKREVFEEKFEAKIALINFSKQEGPLTYEPEDYNPVVRAAIDGYIEYVRENYGTFVRVRDREELEENDLERTTLHNALAQTLQDEKVVTTFKLGRTIGRLLLVDQQLDTYDTAMLPDVRFPKRRLA